MIHESVHAGEAQANPAKFSADAKAERGQPSAPERLIVQHKFNLLNQTVVVWEKRYQLWLIDANRCKRGSWIATLSQSNRG
jgi:hypothetical protein